MTKAGEYSYREICTQGDSWQSAIDASLAAQESLQSLLSGSQDDGLVFIGCGSTHYLARYAAPFFQETTGIACRGMASSELALQTETLITTGQRPLIVALSRSGETSETIMAVDKMRRRGCRALAISCYGDAPLSEACDLTIAVTAGQEQSFAQTRSFAGMLVAVQVAAALAAGNDDLLRDLAQLPELAEDIIRRSDPLAAQVGGDENLKRITYLGSGANYGLASEATVKMKEMSLSLAEPYRFMEFRHGPMSLVDAEHLIVALVSERMRGYELAVLRDLKERGAHILAIANHAQDLSEVCDQVFALGTRLSEPARAVLYLPLLQLLAYHRAIGRGLNPDRPRNVVMAIQLDGTEMIS